MVQGEKGGRTYPCGERKRFEPRCVFEDAQDRSLVYLAGASYNV